MYTEMRIVEVIYLPMFTVLPEWGSLSREGISLYLWIHCLLTQEHRLLTLIIALELMHSCGFETCHKHTTFLEWLTPRTLRITYYVLVISVPGIDFVPVRAQITFRLRLQFFFSANQWVLWVQNWLTENPSTFVLIVDISGILCGPGLKKERKTITEWVCRTCGPIVRWSQSCIPLRGDPEQHVKC